MPVTLLASACPAPPTVGTVYYPIDKYASAASVPPYLPYVTNMTTETSSTLNQNQAVNALGFRYGAGAYGVGYGLGVTAGVGLLATVAAGIGVMDGVVALKNGGSVVVDNNSAREWIWLKQDGTFTVQHNTTARPSGNNVLVGSCVTSSGAVTSVDSSGVCYFRGSEIWRDTADTGAPSDLPDSSLRLYTKTLAGVFYWDGTLWRSVGNTYLAVTGSKSDANYTQTQTEYWVARYKAAWTGWTTGRDLIVPLMNNWQQWVTNATGQNLRVIGATGTGITIANTKSALVASDGTNIVRLTLDA